MKLKSYFNPNATNTVFTVQIRKAADAAPGAPQAPVTAQAPVASSSDNAYL